MKKKEVQKKNKIFGTDGIRSEYGIYPLDEDSIRKLGKAIGIAIKGSKILIGRDTRRSGIEIENLLNISLSRETDIKSCGIVPTPVLSFLVANGDFDFGIMITASHNPYYDNGIKLFKHNGEKCEDVAEKIEEIFFSLEDINEISTPIESVLYEPGDKYKDYIRGVIKNENLLLKRKNKKPQKIIIDCANGAFFKEAQETFSSLGFTEIIYINNKPDGTNINENCGALYTDQLSKTVKAESADLGVAFDGDGDRLICVDKNGFVLNGDHMILLIAKYLKNKKNENSIVIGTTMANLGFEKALNKNDIDLIRTDVGDKFVYNEMKKTGAILGGEQSGHIIIKGFKTGDGLLSALYFISAINYFEINVHDIFKQIYIYPQIIKSYPVSDKIPIENWVEMQNEIEKFNREHGKNSRLVIRYSGTEPKIRVMIESESEEIIEKNIKKFEEIIRSN